MATKTVLNSSLLSSLTFIILAIPIHAFLIKEASICDLQLAFKQNQLTSRKLVEFYIGEINRLNSFLKGVIERNHDALRQADKADDELSVKAPVVRRDAGIVVKLREAGAIILEKNPCVLSADPCGSSSGSAISVAANLVAVSLETETDGSILCPFNANSVVGIRPTVGLIIGAGVIPISLRQDTAGLVIFCYPYQLMRFERPIKDRSRNISPIISRKRLPKRK
ncbi:probable amidase At4g34880 [Populus nigra]|uniref:probable amidase At4g34880 n=1 Tax=Populus nigra TaxID=3691 RepID=UPI002B268233|nr:probable amidase At4g34880 [Populus nigra]